MSIKEKIENYKDKLNKSINFDRILTDSDSYDEIYHLSKTLDELILQYYQNSNMKEA